MYIFESAMTLVKDLADFCSGLLTLFITVFIVQNIIYWLYLDCREDEKWNKEKIKHLKSTTKKEYPWRCLLICGTWGSGKTTHYERNYKYIDDKSNIYISCFSASRSELISQIIQQQFWCKLLTLNGLLAKLMESSWQIFMPKNRVVVFDDLERLHDNQNNYLDLIGVIDYLKNTNKCKLILIADISKTRTIFNTYMERIVDELEFPRLIPEKEFIASLINQPTELTKKLLIKLYNSYINDEINNLRIIKNIMPTIADKLEADYSEFNEVEQVINGSYSEIIKLINKHYLFYLNNALFKVCSDINNRKIGDNYTQEYIAKLRKELSKFKLQFEDFICTEYTSFRDIKKILEPDLGNYLKGNIDQLINENQNDSAKIRIFEYLEMFSTKKTKNSFVVYEKRNNLQNEDKKNEHVTSSGFIVLLCYLIWLDRKSEDTIDVIALAYIDEFGIKSVCNNKLKTVFAPYEKYFKAFNQGTYFNENIINRRYVNGHSGRVSEHDDPKLNEFLKVFQRKLVECRLNNIRNISDIRELPFVSVSSNDVIHSYEELWTHINTVEDQSIYKSFYSDLTTKRHSIDLPNQRLLYIIEKIVESIYCYCNNQIFDKVLYSEDQSIIDNYHGNFIGKLNENQIEYLQLSEYVKNDLLNVLKQRLSEYTNKIIKYFRYKNLDELLGIDKNINIKTKDLLKNILGN